MFGKWFFRVKAAGKCASCWTENEQYLCMAMAMLGVAYHTPKGLMYVQQGSRLQSTCLHRLLPDTGWWRQSQAHL